MAETKKAPAKGESANGQDKSNLPIVVGGKTVSIEEAAAALKAMDTGEKDSSYLEMEPGEERRVVFLGWDEINGMGDNAGKMVPAVSLVTDSGKKQINADAVIVSYFEKQSVGVARKIVCTGIKKSKGGFEYKTFDFYELNSKK